jgi:D-inositol-3-phosphate glycosyltransferase
VFVSTARHEGFGMAALEALAAGVPVVAQTNPHVAIGEFVADGRSGRLVEGHDPLELAAAVTDLAADRSRLARASQVAAADARGHRAAESAASHAELYRSVLGLSSMGHSLRAG